MTIPTTRGAYADCYTILETALTQPLGVRLKVASYEAAVFLRMRIHMARKIHRKDNAAIYEDPGHPMHGASPYDRLMVQIRAAESGCYVYIRPAGINLDHVEIEPLTEGMALEEPKEQLQIEVAGAPLMIEHVRRRI